MGKVYAKYYRSPVGIIEIKGTQEGILSILYVDEWEEGAERLPACLEQCAEQLDEYFKGRRIIFSVKVIPQGTDFQKRIWESLQAIPFGATRSYREVAAANGNPKAVRAVGQANGKNRINIIIPCHRVIGARGDLTGYGGGIWRKKWLLEHEKKIIPGDIK